MTVRARTPTNEPEIAEDSEMIVQYFVPGLTNLPPAFALNTARSAGCDPKTRSTGVPNTATCIELRSQRADVSFSNLGFFRLDSDGEMPEMCLENSLASWDKRHNMCWRDKI